MKKYILFFAIFFIASTITFAQKQANNWVLNGGILNFNTEEPTFIASNTSTTRISKSCISDANGNLLFYCDGLTLYTKNANQSSMPNGNNLLGHKSGAFLAGRSIIIPNPSNENLYYVFVNGSYEHGLSYNVVDMRLNNGLGDVTQKNIRLTTRINDDLTATIGADCQTYWVLAHENLTDRFFAYKIDKNGVMGNPVITQIGDKSGTGAMYKFSSNGKKLVVLEGAGKIVVYDFDNQTGKLSNRVLISERATSIAEFSPDATKLYLMGSIGNMNGLIQYDLTANKVFDSGIMIDTKVFFFSISLAQNGKIYLYHSKLSNASSNTGLGIIHQPNERGLACRYELNKIKVPIPEENAYVGTFPNFPSNFLGGVQKDFTFSQPCNSLTINFSATSPNINDTYSWSFGDGSTSNIQNPIKTYTQAGSYAVKLKIGACEFNKTVVVQPKATFTLPTTLELCANQKTVMKQNPENGFTYRWFPTTGLSNPNIANPTINLDNQTDSTKKINYTLFVTHNTNLCKDSAKIAVTVFPALEPISAGKDTTICHLQSLRLSPFSPPFWGGLGGAISPSSGAGGLTYSWFPTTGLDSANIAKPLLKLENNTQNTIKHTYILTATKNGCSISDTVVISVLPKIQAQIIGSATVCPFAKNMKYISPLIGLPSHPEGGIRSKVVKWEIVGGTFVTPPSGAGGLVLINWGQANENALVKVILQNELGCRDSVMLKVKISPLPPEGGSNFAGTPPSGVGGLVLCHGESREIGLPPLPNHTYLWKNTSAVIDTLVSLSKNNVANPTLNNLTKNDKISSQKFTVFVRNESTGCEYVDSVTVKIYPQIVFSAGKDTVVCSNKHLVLGSPPAPEGGVSSPPSGVGGLYVWTLNDKKIKISEVLNSNTIAQPTLRYVNTENSPITLRFALTVSLDNCQKTDSVKVIILPSLQKTYIAGSQTVCPNVKGVIYKSPLIGLPNHPEGGIKSKVVKWEVFGGTIVTPPLGVGGLVDSIAVDWHNSNDKAFIRAYLVNELGCADTIQLPVKIQQVLKPTKPVGKIQLCANEAQNISYETTFTNGSSYEWSIFGGKIISQNKNKVIVNWNSPSNNSAISTDNWLLITETSVTQTDKCAGSSDTLRIKILASPDTTLRLVGEENICEFAQNITYQFGNSNTYNTTSKYIWEVENGEIINNSESQNKNAITINWKGIGQGKVSVTEIFANGCVGKKQSLSVKISDLNQCLKIPTLLSSDNVYFPYWHILGLEYYPKAELVIYTVTGAIVYQSSNYTNNCNFSNLASGVYVYVLQVQKGENKIPFRGKIVVGK